MKKLFFMILIGISNHLYGMEKIAVKTEKFHLGAILTALTQKDLLFEKDSYPLEELATFMTQNVKEINNLLTNDNTHPKWKITFLNSVVLPQCGKKLEIQFPRLKEQFLDLFNNKYEPLLKTDDEISVLKQLLREVGTTYCNITSDDVMSNSYYLPVKPIDI